MTAIRWLEHFPKSGNRFLDKKCGENNKREQFVEPSETKTALAQQIVNRFLGFVLCLLISGCAGSGSFSHQWTVQEPALPVMEKITSQANECWFKSGKADFKSYRLAPELNSFVDRPRLLLVPYHQPTARPILVIEASGNPAQISAYGPLLTGKMGKNIRRDINLWLEDRSQC